MKETVSIIIPVYNSELYLTRCVDSVLAQTYSKIEVLLIDDGSTDNSYSLCQQYAQHDSRVKVLHQDNQGAAAARNTGLDNATGDYIMFCDSDDIVSLDWTKHMIESLSGDNVILPICGNCSEVLELGKKSKSDLTRNQYIPKNDLFKNKLNYHIGFLWNTLFYNNLIQEHGLRFREQGDKADYNEDLLFVTSYLCYVDGLVYTGYDDYAYLTREESLSRSFTPYYFEKFAEKFNIWYHIAEDIKDNSAKYEISTYFLYHFLVALQDSFNKGNKEKFKYIINSDVTQKCILNADTSNEDARIVSMIKKKKCSALWCYYKIVHFKNILK